MAADSRRVIDPGTQFELLTNADTPDLSGRRDVPIGLRCAVCREEAPLGSDVSHAAGCSQADVRLHLTGD